MKPGDFTLSSDREIKWTGPEDKQVSIYEYMNFIAHMEDDPKDLIKDARKTILNCEEYALENDGDNVQTKHITISTHMLDDYVKATNKKRPTKINVGILLPRFIPIIETDDAYVVKPETTYNPYPVNEAAFEGYFNLDVSDMNIAAAVMTFEVAAKYPSHDDWIDEDGDYRPAYSRWTTLDNVTEILFFNGEPEKIRGNGLRGDDNSYKFKADEEPWVLLMKHKDDHGTIFSRPILPLLDLEYLLSERERLDRRKKREIL
jgi:hypothetical protein